MQGQLVISYLYHDQHVIIVDSHDFATLACLLMIMVYIAKKHAWHYNYTILLGLGESCKQLAQAKAAINRTTFFSVWFGNGHLFYLSHGKDRQIINRACLIKCNQVNSSSTELPKVFVYFGPGSTVFKAYKWRDCLNHEGAFYYISKVLYNPKVVCKI